MDMTESLERHDAAARELASLGLTAEDWQLLTSVTTELHKGDDTGASPDPVAISEQESAVEDWLADRGIAEGWRLASSLVAAGVNETILQQLANQLPPDALGATVRWIGESIAVRGAVDVVCRSSSRISDLVTAVKAYSYMDRAAEQIVDVHDGLENTRIILAHRLRDMSVTTDYDRSLPPVRAFGSGLNQVCTNIIDNAVDATGGHGAILIRTSRADNAVQVEIGDNGCGIPSENLTRVFEPFFTTKPQGSGTGLGLDTAWRIVTEEHGGTIDVESGPGGTVFRVVLPLADANTNPTDA
jgi:signal transduction histidine kinase